MALSNIQLKTSVLKVLLLPYWSTALRILLSFKTHRTVKGVQFPCILLFLYSCTLYTLHTLLALQLLWWPPKK